MRITCPDCDAAYDLPDHKLVPGRRVRCARCGQDWVPVSTALDPFAEPTGVAPGPAALPDDVAGRSATTGPALSDPGPPPATVVAEQVAPVAERLSIASVLPAVPLGLKAAWGVSLLTLVMLAASIVVWRDSLVHHWPPGARLLGGVSAAPHP